MTRRSSPRRRRRSSERVGTGNTTHRHDVRHSHLYRRRFDRPPGRQRGVLATSFRYLDAQGHDVTATLTDAQKAAIAAVEIPLERGAGGGKYP